MSRVVLNEGLTYIGENAFKGCTSLESISIPSTVTNIEFRAFNQCRNLRELTLNEGLKEIDFEAFEIASISDRLNDIIQSGHWVGIERKIDNMPHVEWTGSKLLVSAVDISLTWWIDIKERLRPAISLITYYEIKEFTSIFELALWKAKIDQAEDTDMGGRDACRIEVPGPVKDVILQYLAASNDIFTATACYLDAFDP